MEKLAQRCCPLCEGSRCTVMHSQRFALPEGHPLTHGYDVVGCMRCGFVYADSAATQADYDVFYARFSKYEDTQHAPGAGESPADADRLRATAAMLARFIPDRAAPILDVGCAGGGLLRALRHEGFQNLAGLDPSPVCAEQTRRAAGVPVAVGSLSALPPDLGTFAGIILSHVLEHVHDVRAALHAVDGLLKPGGWLYLETPDASRYAEYFVTPFHYFDTEHINHFDADSLENALRLLGYRTEAKDVKETPLTDAVAYPAAYVLGRKAGDPPRALQEAHALRPGVERYIARSRQDLEFTAVEQIADSGRSVVVWGVGCSTTRLLASSALGRANIRCFVDNNPQTWGQELHGRQVISPAQLAALSDPIVITSKLYGGQIRAQVRDALHLANEIILLYREEAS